MNEMMHIAMTANGAVEPTGSDGDALMLVVSGNFGAGTLSVQKYSKDRAAFVTVATYSAATTTPQELKLGWGRIQFSLAGATTPALDIDYWIV